MIDSIMDIMENNIASIFLSAKPVESTLHYHEEIYQAIKNHFPGKAQDLMLRHIQDIQRTLEVKQRGSVEGSKKGRNKKMLTEEVFNG
jgi:DNA-binding FadR family transcriptional regulator